MAPDLLPLRWTDKYEERDGISVFLHSVIVYERRTDPRTHGTRGRPRFFLRFSFPCMATPRETLRWDVLPSLLAAAEERQTLAGVKGSSATPPLSPGEVDGPELPIDPCEVFPLFEQHLFTRAPSRDPTVLEKTPRLLSYNDPTARKKCKEWLRSEALVLELLKKHPHPHIVKYHGVVLEVDRIAGLAFERLPHRLDQRCGAAAPPLDVAKVISGVSQALSHLHGLGYCHNDVNPQNIMLTDDDEAVLIDFDSCLPEGMPLSKGTTPTWGNGATVSSRENDMACLSQVKDLLREAFATAP